jgi:hypothetical protein
MSTGPSDFKLTNVKRAFTAAKMAGVDVARMDIAANGTISIIPVRGPQNDRPPEALDKAPAKPR